MPGFRTARTTSRWHGGRRGLALVVVVATMSLVGCGADGPGRQSVSSSRDEQPSPSTPGSEPVRTTSARLEAGSYCLRPADEARTVRFGPHRSLGGYMLGSGGRYVVLAHQLGGDSCQLLDLARRLAAAGYRPLAFDFPGVGSSVNASTNGVLALAVLSAARFCLQEGKAQSVSLIGASMGGYAVLDAALRGHLPLAAVVSLSAPGLWDDPQGHPLDIASLDIPVQLWDSRWDTGFVDSARSFAKQDAAAELHIEPGSGHGVQLVAAAFARIRAFLDSATGSR